MPPNPTDMRHIGILAHSADGAALCFLEMVREASRGLGAHQHPEITLSILPMGPTLALYERIDLGDPHAVSEELDRQLETFERLLGRPPTHIDSHQHVHLREPVREAVIAAAGSLDVPVRRITPSIAYRGEFYGQTGRGEPVPQGITPEALARIVASLTDGVTELACHPGIAWEGSPYGEERTRETAVLSDPRAHEAVAAAGRRAVGVAAVDAGRVAEVS